MQRISLYQKIYLVIFVIFAVGVAVILGSHRASTPSDQSATRSILDDVAYTFTVKKIVPGINRTLEVQLNGEVSKEVLTAIAIKLKNADPNAYDRTLIGYYLPGMESNAGYWATTHFDPNLEVQIWGFASGQKEDLIHQSVDPSRETIGTWINEGVGELITIFKKNGGLFLHDTYSDNSTTMEEIVEVPSLKVPYNRRFESKEDSEISEYYIINSKGELQIFDRKYGLYATMNEVNQH